MLARGGCSPTAAASADRRLGGEKLVASAKFVSRYRRIAARAVAENTPLLLNIIVVGNRTRSVVGGCNWCAFRIVGVVERERGKKAENIIILYHCH